MDKTYNVTPTDTAGPEISIFMIEKKVRGIISLELEPNLSTHLE